MRFVWIYGPPGVGKLTIGRALAGRLDFRLFHQHLAFDIADAIFGLGTKEFEICQRKVCLDAFEAAVEGNIKGLIFTYCYVHPQSRSFVEDTLDFLARHHISPDYVRLTCSLVEHERRATSDARRNTNKVKTVERLHAYLSKYEFLVDMPGVTTHHVDTTYLSPDETAAMIMDTCALVQS